MTSFLSPVSMRPILDKDLEPIDLDQLFDQYVEKNLLQHFDSDNIADPSSSDDLVHLFELPDLNGSDARESSVLPDWDAGIARDAWHKAVLSLGEQNLASSSTDIFETSTNVYPESRGKNSHSDPGLICFKDLFRLDSVEPRALSQPSTPNSHSTSTRPTTKARSSPDRSVLHRIHKSPKNSTLSGTAAKMMRSPHCRTGFQELWPRKLDTTDTFNLVLPPNGIHSPPSSAKTPQDEHGNAFLVRDLRPYTTAVDVPMSPDLHHTNYQLTPLTSPAMDTSSSRNGDTANPFQFPNDGMENVYISQHLDSGAALSALQTPPPTQRLPTGAWDSSSLDFSSFTASPEFETPSEKPNGWWSSTIGSVPVSQPSTPSAYPTSHSGPASQNMGFSAASVAGLGISCDTASFSGFGDSLNGVPNGLQSSASFDMAYPALYDTTTPGIPIGIPTENASRSPSGSPQPRFTRRRHSAHPSHPHSSNHHIRTPQSRRKSSNSTTASHTHTQRSSSQSVGSFVNYTPSDSKKILTGVAPSGSSKTKARREKEAADKRRKLSQAAVKAVMEAGGDLGSLEREGLLLEG